MPNDNQAARDVAANKLVATLGGQELARPLSAEIGNEALYEQFDETDLGSFVGYRPIPFRLRFPITKNKVLRDIGKSEAEMKKDYAITVRFMAADNRTPLTTTNLTNVRLTRVVQVYPGGNQQPFEEITGTATAVTHEN